MPRARSTDAFVASAASTKLKNIRVAASASFSEEEIGALSEVLTKLLAGGDVRAMRSSKALGGLMRKLPVMKAAIERQKERRAAHEAAKPKT
jgi:hypothetical protein